MVIWEGCQVCPTSLQLEDAKETRGCGEDAKYAG